MEPFDFRLNPAARQLGRCSAILNGLATHYRVDSYRTTLSIKAVQSGAALYVTPKARHLVTPDCYLILNRGQEYALEFQWPTPTETLCPFFQPAFVEHAAYCASESIRKQLDEIEDRARPLSFCERLYPRTGRLGALLDVLYQGVKAGQASGGWLEDHFYVLAEALVELSGIEYLEIDQIGACRAATREELYRRLHRGRDYLSACYAEPVTVARAAAAATLSPHHFHRQFRAVFGQTPMRFVQMRRLDAARRLLLTTDLPVTTVCFSAGFQSLGSFISLFGRRFGSSPRHFRRKAEKSQISRREEVSERRGI
jgi:AraC-like DNA-binding protein